ncbi:Asp-tRNA(Asn)/Glu-tRNA(Gln) amidotransferase subunit GatC [Mycoplasma sp. P36-A1]|uniref:Asp-tRNA(Asn)/Glu-tRNA(Gln) amidotransferase subunit GatC n=1 Tax=Mycoplasma sp. P36-A1 TaxID=3252900 RepID=UPI003C2BD34B
MDRAQVEVYLKDLYLSAESEEEMEFIMAEFTQIAKAVQHFNEIDVTGVEDASWPFLFEGTYLREDVVDNTLTHDDALRNVAKTQDGYVKYVKVVQ